jgi:predicted DNA-binding protein (MmcQ/YjbR family)
VGGKVFAIGGWDDGESRFTFKAGDIAYEMLKDRLGLRPAPYLASRGMKWIQHYAEPGLSDDELRDYLRQSHRIVSLGLTKKKQRELGLNQQPTRVSNDDDTCRQKKAQNDDISREKDDI